MAFPLSEQHITVDTTNNNYVTVNVKQNDNKTRFIYITLTNGGVPIEFSKIGTAGLYPVLRMLTPNGKHIWNSQYVTFSGDEVKVELSGNALKSAGTAKANIDIYDTPQTAGEEILGHLLSSICFQVHILPSAFGDEEATEAADEMNVLADLIAKANQSTDTIVAKADEAAASAEKAATSETNAKTSENAAAASVAEAKQHETNAQAYDEQAKASAQTAQASASSVSADATAAANYATAAANSAKEAANSADSAKSDADRAETMFNNIGSMNGMFYINDDGELILTQPDAFKGTFSITRADGHLHVAYS